MEVGDWTWRGGFYLGVGFGAIKQEENFLDDSIVLKQTIIDIIKNGIKF